MVVGLEAVVIVDDDLPGTAADLFVKEVGPETFRWVVVVVVAVAERAVTVLDRAGGFLLAAVVAVVVAVGAVVVDVEGAWDPADGGRGGRRTVAAVSDVADDFARVCVDLMLAVFGDVVSEAEGREEVVGESLEEAGLVSLVVLMAVGLEVAVVVVVVEVLEGCA